MPGTGSLVEVCRGGGFPLDLGGLDRPSSREFIGAAAYVVTLTVEVWKIR